MVQKARPVSSDVGSSNPNFSDLMDEFIQERLRAKGTAVSTIHSLILTLLCLKIKDMNATFSSVHRVAVAAAREAWRFPETCPTSWRPVIVLDHDPQMTFGLPMTRGFPLSGHHLLVPAALMSSVPTASQTPLMPFSTPPANLIVRSTISVICLCATFL